MTDTRYPTPASVAGVPIPHLGEAKEDESKKTKSKAYLRINPWSLKFIQQFPNLFEIFHLASVRV